MNEVLLSCVFITFVLLGDAVNAFQCENAGLFANPDSNDCQTFIWCDYQLRSEVFSCDANTFFWPEKSGCYSQYNCATKSMPNNEDPCKGATYGNVADNTSADCTKYFTCGYKSIVNAYGVLTNLNTVSGAECQSGSVFQPANGCSSTYKCVKDYQCTAKGLFANPKNCSTFIACWSYYSGSNIGFYPEVMSCPSNTKYNPISQKCDQFYKCDGVDPQVSATLNCPNSNPKSVISNPKDKTAASYLQCGYDFGYTGSTNYLGAQSVILKMECPQFSFFSPILGKCSEVYNPKEKCVKDPCICGPGAYPDTKSANCSTFIDCRDDSTTPMLYRASYEIRYCEAGTRFSPELGACSSQYACQPLPAKYCYTPYTTTTFAPVGTPAPAG